MPRIYASNTNGLRVEITLAQRHMRWLDAKSRNTLIRSAFEGAGVAWISAFLPKRFTDYVRRQPFNYPKHGAGWLAKKLRSATKGDLYTAWQKTKARDFMGWDPFADGAIGKVPGLLLDMWIRDHPGMYKYRRLSRYIQIGEGNKVRADIMRWAKKRSYEIASNLSADGIMLPLVMDGTTREAALGGARSQATVTTKKARLTITIPRGHAIPQRYSDIISMLPEWEFNYIRQHFAANLKAAISPLANARMAGIMAGIATKKAASDARMESRVASRVQSLAQRKVK